MQRPPRGAACTRGSRGPGSDTGRTQGPPRGAACTRGSDGPVLDTRRTEHTPARFGTMVLSASLHRHVS